MKKHLLMLALQLAASGADAYMTQRNMSMPQHSEHNPFARTFVSHGTPLLATYFVAQTGVKLYTVYLLRKHEHQQLADAVAVAGIADNTYGAVTSTLGHTK